MGAYFVQALQKALGLAQGEFSVPSGAVNEENQNSQSHLTTSKEILYGMAAVYRALARQQLVRKGEQGGKGRLAPDLLVNHLLKELLLGTN